MQSWTIEAERREKILESLTQSYWFKSLEATEIDALLDFATLVSYDNGETILSEGDPSDSFFLLLKGVVTIEGQSKQETTELGRIRAPFSFGEIGVLLSSPRTASIVAEDSAMALRFEAQALRRMIEASPEFGINLSRALASRLTQVSQLVQLPQEYRSGRPADEVLRLLPLRFMERHRVLPLRMRDGILTIGFVDPPLPSVMAGLHQNLAGIDLESVAIDARQFDEVLSSLAGAEEWRGVDESVATNVAQGPGSPKLDVLLRRVVAEGASDLHLAAGRKPRWRIDGDLLPIEDIAPLGENEVFELFEPILEARRLEEFQANHDTDFAYSPDGSSRFRINLYRSLRGVDAAVRQISTRVLEFSQLGLPSFMEKLCNHPTGLVLVTGATGSGKSTSVAAMVDYINRHRQCHILTLEDPIELVYEDRQALIHQREIGGHTHGFAQALRAGLREDPDVVVVGEIRDPETMSLVLEVASSGHLVFATLHTASVVLTVQLIIEMFPGNEQNQARATLADTLRGIVCQTLLKKRGGGRIPAVELMTVNMAISHLIREGKSTQIPNAMHSDRTDGNFLLNEELARLVDERRVLYKEAQSKSGNKKDLAKRLDRPSG